MKIVSFELKPLKFALPASAANVRREWLEREVLVLQLRDERNQVGFGEASPLPGYSSDTLAQCGSALGGINWQSVGSLDLNKPTAVEIEAVLNRMGALPPAARFAVETALFDLSGKRLQLPMYRLLGSSPVPQPVPLSALLDAETPKRALESARSAWDRGIRTLKVKLGPPALAEWNLDILKLLRGELGRELILRADANGRFESQDAERLVRRLVEISLEFLEEPCPFDSVAKWETSAIPLALDESLQDGRNWDRIDQLIRRGVCKFVVLKPAALGGAIRCLELSKRFEALGAHPLVTHMWDGPVGFAATASLALAMPSRAVACGLDGYSGMSRAGERNVPFLTANELVPSGLPGLGLHEELKP